MPDISDISVTQNGRTVATAGYGSTSNNNSKVDLGMVNWLTVGTPNKVHWFKGQRVHLTATFDKRGEGNLSQDMVIESIGEHLNAMSLRRD